MESTRDNHAVLQQLEEAAKALLAPPNQVSGEQRHEAERKFLEFRRFSQPYEICRYILENSKNDYAQFQAAATIKSGIVREWASLTKEDIEMLRMFLLQFVVTHRQLQLYVREEILQTHAVIFKRGLLDLDSVAKDSIFAEVTQLISTGDLTMQLIACNILTALLNEFSSSSKSSEAGFSWNFHIICKRNFEDNLLHQALVFTLQVLNELLSSATVPLDRFHLPVMHRFLLIAEQILNWEFLPAKLTRRHMAPFSIVTPSSFRPPVTWKETIFNADFLSLFFKLHAKVHYNSELSHHTLQCICQLSSISGPLMEGEEPQMAFLSHFISQFLMLMSSVQPCSNDALNLACVFENLIRWFSVEKFAHLPENLRTPFVDWMARLSCDYIQAAAREDEEHCDENIYKECLERMLFSWATFLSEAGDHFNSNQFEKHITEIFSSYIKYHLSNSNKRQTTADDAEEYQEEEEVDRLKFADQLICIGALGREIANKSLPLLCRLLNEKAEQLQGDIAMIRRRTQTTNILEASINSTTLNAHFEDLHWLLLIAGHVLTDDSQGETAVIPSNLLNISSAPVDMQKTLDLLVHPLVPASPHTQTDQIVRLLSCVLRVFSIQKEAVESNLSEYLSPQLDSTGAWFLRRFIETYLIPSEELYPGMNITLLTVLGRDSPASYSLIDAVVDKLMTNLSIFNAEPDVLSETLELLTSLVAKRNRCEAVVKCESFSRLIHGISGNEFPFNTLPASAKRLLYKTIVVAGSAVALGENRESYWDNLIKRPVSEFTSFVSSDAFSKNKDDSSVRESLIHSLELIIGCCQATRIDNKDVLFDILEPSLTATIRVLDVCHTYDDLVQSCLELFCETVKAMICSLDSTPSERLYELCLSAIHTYAKYKSGRRSIEPDAEENKYRDILLILELLLSLISKDLIDFGLQDNGDVRAVSATEVVLFGLTVTVPLMDASLLQFPYLCSQYFKLLAFIAEIRPDKLLELPDVLLQMVVDSIRLSLTDFGSDIAKLGFEFLTELAMYMTQPQQKRQSSVSRVQLQQFVQPLLNQLLFEVFDLDLLDTISGALYYLIHLYTEKYKELEHLILEQHRDKAYYQLLQHGLAVLRDIATSQVASRQNKLNFMDNMNKFLLEIKGSLCSR